MRLSQVAITAAVERFGGVVGGVLGTAPWIFFETEVPLPAGLPGKMYCVSFFLPLGGV